MDKFYKKRCFENYPERERRRKINQRSNHQQSFNYTFNNILLWVFFFSICLIFVLYNFLSLYSVVYRVLMRKAIDLRNSAVVSHTRVQRKKFSLIGQHFAMIQVWIGVCVFFCICAYIYM